MGCGRPVARDLPVGEARGAEANVEGFGAAGCEVQRTPAPKHFGPAGILHVLARGTVSTMYRITWMAHSADRSGKAGP